MRKNSLLLIISLLLFITGCSRNQIKCTGTITDEGLTMKAEMIAYLDKDNKVTDATVSYELKDQELMDTYCSMFKMMEEGYDGLRVTCSKTKITLDGYLTLLSEEESKELLGISKEGFIEAMEADKFICK